MDYKDNIRQRELIEKKVYDSQKLTKEEKWWLKSNPVFNPRYEFPCYQRDVIQISQKTETVVTISPTSNNDKTKIYRPVISVIGKGVIKVDSQLLDIDKKEVSYNETKILIPLFAEKNSISVKAVSESGLIGVWYQCEYYDERMRLYTIEMSDGANMFFGMKKSILSDNEFLYSCKSPTVPNESEVDFDAFTFSIKISEFNK
jgi:uncharacterized beta-barrel protein YwiB (DUF1934 family)